MVRLHGVPFSAHTRKVIITALEKGIAYELVPVVPLTPPKGWEELSPLGLIPVIQDGETTLADSSVIGLYLEKMYPERPFYTSDPRPPHDGADRSVHRILRLSHLRSESRSLPAASSPGSNGGVGRGDAVPGRESLKLDLSHQR